MRLATAVCLAITTTSILAAPIAGSESLRGGRMQAMVVDLSVLRHEFHDKGWQHSFVVHLGDTWASFVSGQLNALHRGDYSNLVDEVEDLAEDLDRDAKSLGARDPKGGWEPVGWGDCDDARDLILLRRRLR